MAYAAVISLKQTIQRLSQSPHISIAENSSPQIKEYLYEEVCSLEQALASLDESVYSSTMGRVNVLDGQIRDAVYELEDVIETQISNLFLTRGEDDDDDDDPRSLLLCVDLQDLKQELDSITKRVKKMKEAYIEEVMSPSPEEEQVKDPIWRPDFGEKKSKMVGLSLFRTQVRELLTRDQVGWRRNVFLIGMAGLGKTALAREMLEDAAIVDHFECRAWVKVGPKYQLNHILRSILTQVDPDIDKMLSWEGSDEELAAYLMDRRYLVVFDDVWNSRAYRDLSILLPNNNRKASRIMVTTRMHKVHRSTGGFFSLLQFPFLDKEKSWQLLREKVFGEDGSWPRQLEKAGKKIAENCEGLPLTILKVAKIMSGADKTLEFWNKVAEKESSVFSDVYDQMLKVLYPSYYYLPQAFKACFLYMGVLPQNYELPISKIFNLWSAEGFLEPTPSRDFDQIVRKCLKKLENGNVVIARHKIVVWGPSQKDSDNKKYHVHSALLHLCVSAARDIKFYRLLKRFDEDAAQDIQGQRRLCVRNNVLFSINVLCPHF